MCYEPRAIQLPAGTNTHYPCGVLPPSDRLRLLSVFSAALHVSVSALCSRYMGKHLCVWCTCGICHCFVLRCAYKVHAVDAPRCECHSLSAALISSYKPQMVTVVLIKLSMPPQEDGSDQVSCLLPLYTVSVSINEQESATFPRDGVGGVGVPTKCLAPIPPIHKCLTKR